MNVKLLTLTWNHEDNFDIQKTSLYQSFRKYNPDVEIVHYHFNRGYHQQKEMEYRNIFGDESEYLLYKIEFLLEKVKNINSEYIIFSDANDVTCIKSINHLFQIYDLENNIIIGHEKNMWPTQEIKNSWLNYIDYDDVHKNNRTYLNSGMILSKTKMFIEMLEKMISDVFSTKIKTFKNDQGVYTYYYNMGMSPKIKLDTSNNFALNTFSRSVDEYYLNNQNQLVSKETGIIPCFVHDNGWNHGSPKYHDYFGLVKTYQLTHNIPEYLSGDSSDYHVLINAVKKIKDIPGTICELGTRRGGSIRKIIDSLIENNDYDRNILCIDPYGNLEYNVAENRKIRGGYDNKMRNEFLISICDYILNKPVNLVLLNLEDFEFFDRFKDGVPFYNKNKNIINQYSFVFFDGPHDSDSIMKEIEFFNPRSVNGSVWVFDDIKDNYPHDEIIEKWLFENNWVCLEKTNKKASYKKIYYEFT
jgi:hypothetical protein